MDFKSTNGPMKCVFVSRLLHAISTLQTTLYQLSLAHLDHVGLLILHLFRAPNEFDLHKRLHRNRFQIWEGIGEYDHSPPRRLPSTPRSSPQASINVEISSLSHHRRDYPLEIFPLRALLSATTSSRDIHELPTPDRYPAPVRANVDALGNIRSSNRRSINPVIPLGFQLLGRDLLDGLPANAILNPIQVYSAFITRELLHCLRKATTQGRMINTQLWLDWFSDWIDLGDFSKLLFDYPSADSQV